MSENDAPVEQATAAPGEKRAVRHTTFSPQCPICDLAMDAITDGSGRTGWFCPNDANHD